MIGVFVPFFPDSPTDWSLGYVICESGCWEWTGGRSAGYGRFRDRAAETMCFAHRAAYTRARGPIPDGKQIDHLCRNRACVNPAHLDIVTIRENVLRGVGPTAINARKTHCPQGHPYDAENTYRHATGRQCRICCEAHRQRWRERQRNAMQETS